jgi:hypothetical protein
MSDEVFSVYMKDRRDKKLMQKRGLEKLKGRHYLVELGAQI